MIRILKRIIVTLCLLLFLICPACIDDKNDVDKNEDQSNNESETDTDTNSTNDTESSNTGVDTANCVINESLVGTWTHINTEDIIKILTLSSDGSGSWGDWYDDCVWCSQNSLLILNCVGTHEVNNTLIENDSLKTTFWQNGDTIYLSIPIRTEGTGKNGTWVQTTIDTFEGTDIFYGKMTRTIVIQGDTLTFEETQEEIVNGENADDDPASFSGIVSWSNSNIEIVVTEANFWGEVLVDDVLYGCWYEDGEVILIDPWQYETTQLDCSSSKFSPSTYIKQ